MASDWDKILAGGALDSQSEEIANDRIRGQALLAQLNASSAGDPPCASACAASCSATVPLPAG
ncbi:hypothetical protein [Aeromonas salmonicida]